jgi:hypothetical protein
MRVEITKRSLRTLRGGRQVLTGIMSVLFNTGTQEHGGGGDEGLVRVLCKINSCY